MSRDKGKRGERRVIDWLQPISDELHDRAEKKRVLLQRNTVQSDEGGFDIIGLPWLAAEVKNVKAQGPKALADWWAQCHGQAYEGQTPILFYLTKGGAIRVRMMGWCGGAISSAEPEAEPDLGVQCLVDISEEAFENYFRARLAHEIAKQQKRKA